MDHEAHSGWRADDIASEIQGWAAAAAPDIVLLHLGTNDLCQGQTVESTISDISGIIDRLRTVNPRIRILLAQIITCVWGCQIPTFNEQAALLVAAKTTGDSPIVLVDQYTGFDPQTMTRDGQHPNAPGEMQMADRWFSKLIPVLDAFFMRST